VAASAPLRLAQRRGWRIARVGAVAGLLWFTVAAVHAASTAVKDINGNIIGFTADSKACDDYNFASIPWFDCMRQCMQHNERLWRERDAINNSIRAGQAEEAEKRREAARERDIENRKSSLMRIATDDLRDSPGRGGSYLQDLELAVERAQALRSELGELHEQQLAILESDLARLQTTVASTGTTTALYGSPDPALAAGTDGKDDLSSRLRMLERQVSADARTGSEETSRAVRGEVDDLTRRQRQARDTLETAKSEGTMRGLQGFVAASQQLNTLAGGTGQGGTGAAGMTGGAGAPSRECQQRAQMLNQRASNITRNTGPGMCASFRSLLQIHEEMLALINSGCPAFDRNEVMHNIKISRDGINATCSNMSSGGGSSGNSATTRR
jgi:hypothetical protein